MESRISFIVLILFSLILSCAPASQPCAVTGGKKTLTINWAASHAYEVTSVAGGGHKIYYSSAAGVTKSTPNVIDVPVSSSATSGTISGLTSGCKYYVRVGAYSALNPAGGNLSSENSITIP